MSNLYVFVLRVILTQEREREREGECRPTVAKSSNKNDLACSSPRRSNEGRGKRRVDWNINVINPSDRGKLGCTFDIARSARALRRTRSTFHWCVLAYLRSHCNAIQRAHSSVLSPRFFLSRFSALFSAALSTDARKFLYFFPPISRSTFLVAEERLNNFSNVTLVPTHSLLFRVRIRRMSELFPEVNYILQRSPISAGPFCFLVENWQKRVKFFSNIE